MSQQKEDLREHHKGKEREDCACSCVFELQALLLLVNVLEEGMARVNTDRRT